MAIHAGGDLNNVWGDDSDNSEAGIGFNFGGAVKFSLPLLPLTVEANVLADMRNYQFEYSLSDYSVTQWNIDIPVIARFSLLPILFVEAGPQFSFNLSQYAEDSAGDEVKLFDDLLPTNSFEFDLVFGVGTGIIPFVDVDFRFVLGLSNIYQDVSVPLVGTEEVKVSNMQFVLGATYWF